MGIQSRRLNLTMKLLLTALFCGAALALPNGRILRPEEHWRPAGARDLSKYTARHATVSANSPNSYIELARALRSNNKSGSTHKTASIDLQSECGIEDLRLSPTSGHGRWLCSLTTLGSVEVPSSLRT